MLALRSSAANIAVYSVDHQAKTAKAYAGRKSRTALRRERIRLRGSAPARTEKCLIEDLSLASEAAIFNEASLDVRDVSFAIA